MQQAKILMAMCLFEAQRFRAYPLEIIASIAARLIEALLFITFWLLVGQFSGNTAINPQDIISFYLIISGLTPFLYAGFGIAGQTIELIKTGQLSHTLIRPVNPILYPWSLRTGRNAVNLLIGFLQISIGMGLAGGMDVAALPFLLPTLWNAIVINMAINIILGTAAFYLTDARGLKNAFLHIATFARGERMPLHLMSPAVAGFLLLTPFPASSYHLTIVLQGARLPVWSDVLIGFAWSIALLAGAIWFWRHGLKHYEAVGL